MTFDSEAPYNREPYGICNVCHEPLDLGPGDEPVCYHCPTTFEAEVDAKARPGD